MVGILQIITYLLCVYLVFKGVEIYQIALMSPRWESRNDGLKIGYVAIAASIILGLLFAYWVDVQATAIGRTKIPRF